MLLKFFLVNLQPYEEAEIQLLARNIDILIELIKDSAAQWLYAHKEEEE